MIFRRAVFAVFASLLLVHPACAAPATENNLLRLHWLGLKSVSADTNAAQLMKVWQLPQTVALVAQTLDKLSRCPGHGNTNAASAALRPLLDDLITSEFYLELSASTNHQPSTINYQLSLALRLPADRARLWQTNLAAASAAWAAAGTPHRIDVSRTGDWTLVGVGLDKPIGKSAFAARLTLPSLSGTHDWLEADFALSHLTPTLSPHPTGGEGGDEAGIFSTINHQLSTINSLHLTLSGDAGNVHTRATADFSRPLETPLPVWQIPTNLIHAELTSFTAVRGFAPWLTTLPAWQNLQLAPVPDQAFVWAQSGAPFQTYFAAPLPGASNQLAHLAGLLVQNVNPWLATNFQGEFSFQWSASLPGLVWNDALIFSPYLKPILGNQQDYVLGGMMPLPAGDTSPPPAEILHVMLGITNLVYYQTENTGSRIEEALWITQLFRSVFHKPPLPPAGAAATWLSKTEPLLGGSATSVTLTGPQQFTLARNSTTGFTALELHLLADWLESPHFPRGLHTFLAPPDKTP